MNQRQPGFKELAMAMLALVLLLVVIPPLFIRLIRLPFFTWAFGDFMPD